MKYLLEVETYSMPGHKEYVAKVLSKEEAKKVFGNRIALSNKENAIKFDTFKEAEKYAKSNDVYHLVTIIQESS